MEGGVGVVEVGVISWLIPGISERRRCNPLDPFALPEEEPPAAAVSPVDPDKVLFVAEDRDDCTAAFPAMDAVDETAVRLFCCILLA